MSDILCFTARALCREDFLDRIAALAAAHPRGIVLREKDLCEDEYEALAKQVLDVCRGYGTRCILHGFPAVARRLGCDAIHLPLPILRGLAESDKAAFRILGASCHSVQDVREAQALGCTYLTSGHIFETDCKKGLPGRGLAFLREACASVPIPVYAIGGIDASNIGAVRACGAAGGCVMSGAMTCADPRAYLTLFKEGFHAVQP